VADELDEGFSQGLSELGVWGDYVHGRKDRKAYSNADYLQGLQHHVLPSEAGQPLVPDGSQKLLDIRVCHELQTTTKHSVPQRVLSSKQRWEYGNER